MSNDAGIVPVWHQTPNLTSIMSDRRLSRRHGYLAKYPYGYAARCRDVRPMDAGVSCPVKKIVGQHTTTGMSIDAPESTASIVLGLGGQGSCNPPIQHSITQARTQRQQLANQAYAPSARHRGKARKHSAQKPREQEALSWRLRCQRRGRGR